LTWHSTVMMTHGVTSLTTGRVNTGTQQAVSLHRRNTVEDETEMIDICMMSSAVEMHMTGLKSGIRSASALNKSSVKKGTMITTVPSTTNHTDSILSNRAQCRRSQSTCHTSWQTMCQSTFHHPPGLGSLYFPRGQSFPRATYVGYSPVTSMPCAHIQESTGT
jgi:hypothetical protein